MVENIKYIRLSKSLGFYMSTLAAFLRIIGDNALSCTENHVLMPRGRVEGFSRNGMVPRTTTVKDSIVTIRADSRMKIIKVRLLMKVFQQRPCICE